MLDRRDVLKSGTAAAALMAMTAPLARAADAPPDAVSDKFNKLIAEFMDQYLDASPELEAKTALGLDTGARAPGRRQSWTIVRSMRSPRTRRSSANN